METLKFSTRNKKLMELASHSGKRVVAFNLPAGHTCPAASLCLAKADRITGKLSYGKDCKFTCYAALTECVFPNTRKAVWYNYDLLSGKSADSMAELIIKSMPNKTDIVRIHSDGDFFSRKYFKAWQIVTAELSNIIFFGYTKVLPYVIADKSHNFYLQYSWGGLFDEESIALKVPTAYVRTNPTEYVGIQTVCASHSMGHEDYYKILAGESFAINVHSGVIASAKARKKTK